INLGRSSTVSSKPLGNVVSLSIWSNSEYSAGVEIQPSGPFGVPQGDTVVVPASAQNIVGPSLHVASMTKAGHGTLSRFRDDASAIQKNLKILDISCRLHDNFLTITLEATRGGEAY